jgi:hypothetical protein
MFFNYCKDKQIRKEKRIYIVIANQYKRFLDF